MNNIDFKPDERMANIAFANRLRALRKATGHGLRVFADAIGIREDEYTKYELAECQPPYDVLLEIKCFTSCDLDFLVTGKRFDEKRLSQQNVADQFTSEAFSYPQHTRGWHWETDAQHRVVLSCRPIEERSTPAGAIGMTMWDYNEVDLERDERWKRHKEIVEARRPFENFVYQGRKEFLKVTGKPVFDANGRFQGHCGFCTEASQQDVSDAFKTEPSAETQKP